MDLKEFRAAVDTEDYYRSEVNLTREEGEVEKLLDCLNAVIDWQHMEKEDQKHVGSLHALCVNKLIHPLDDPADFKGDILIMLTYDEYPDDTIKLRYNIEGCFEQDGSLEIWDFKVFWLDHEGHSNPMDYSAFHDLLAAAQSAAGM